MFRIKYWLAYGALILCNLLFLVTNTTFSGFVAGSASSLIVLAEMLICAFVFDVFNKKTPG